MSDSDPAPCVSCGSPMTGHYCASCGERRVHPHDFTFRHFAEHAFEAFTHVDGKIFATLRALLTKPGKLTADYFAGRRRPYIPPLQLFLICNVVYFLVLPLLKWDTLTSTLGSHLNDSYYQDLAHRLVQTKLEAGRSPEAYEHEFNHMASLEAKSLVILFAPLYMIPVALLFRRSGKPALLHLIFALHFCAFFLLVLIANLELANLLILLAKALGHPLSYRMKDTGTAIPLLIAIAVYFYHAGRATYGATAAAAWWKAVVLAAALMPILAIYRFILFFVTLWTT